jgi:prevent-host-death family protein
MRAIRVRVNFHSSWHLEWLHQKSYFSSMKKASITEAKNNLSALIDGLKGGGPVLIVDRGRPVARLEPVGSGDQVDDEGRLARLVRDGVIRPARKVLDQAFFTAELPRTKGGASAVEALIAERREGR